MEVNCITTSVLVNDPLFSCILIYAILELCFVCAVHHDEVRSCGA